MLRIFFRALFGVRVVRLCASSPPVAIALHGSTLLLVARQRHVGWLAYGSVVLRAVRCSCCRSVHCHSPQQVHCAATVCVAAVTNMCIAAAATSIAAAARALLPQTADILQAVMALALKKRLRDYETVDTSVSCDARGLLDGRFNSMCIEGSHWHTPLNMTAHKLEVRGGVGGQRVCCGFLAGRAMCGWVAGSSLSG